MGGGGNWRVPPPSPRRRPSTGVLPVPFAIMLLTAILLLLHSAQAARIFRSPEPHLPAENLPSYPAAAEPRAHGPRQGPSIHLVDDSHVAAPPLPRSAEADDGFFAPGAWRPVREPDGTAPGRGRVSSQTSGFASNPHIASARNLRHEDGEQKVSSEARTSETSPSVNMPTSTLGHSIALVANQLLQSKSDILESHVPEVSAAGSLKEESHWPHASLDMRTPPKLMLQISGQKNAAPDDEESNKKVVPIQDDPMGENFFPSRRQPTTVTLPTPTSSQFVTQITVSTTKKNQTKDSVQQAQTSTPKSNKVDQHPMTPTTLTSNTISNRKSSPTNSAMIKTSTPMPLAITSTVRSSITPSQPPSSTSVKWKIAIPPNRQATRFPPRRPTTTTPNPVSSSTTEGNKKPSHFGLFNSRPNVGGFTKPFSAAGTSRRPTSTITRVTTTPKPVITTISHSTVAVPSHSSPVPTSRPIATTTHPPVSTPATPPRPSTPPTSKPTTSKKPMQTTPTPKKESSVMVQGKKPLVVEKEVVTQTAAMDSIKVGVNPKTESVTTSPAPSSSTTRPRRPSNKRKKNKNRRRRPGKKPASTTQTPFTGTELEVKESPQDDNAGNVVSPLSTRIYNFIAREVMPSMSVGLLGLVVTAGLAGYFLLPTLGLQRRSDVANGGFTPGYTSGGSYGTGQDEDGGIVQTIFQNVMASVNNGEEFERGPRRRRNAVPGNEHENEIDANMNIREENEKWQQENQAGVITTLEPNVPTSTLADNPIRGTPSEETQDTGGTLSDTTEKMPTTIEETQKTPSPPQELTPMYEWEGEYEDYPFTLVGILRRIAEFKLRLGVGLLRATTDVIARYLEDVQHRLRDSDKQNWMRNLDSAIRRIRRDIDPPLAEGEENERIPHPRTRFSRHRRTKRHG